MLPHQIRSVSAAAIRPKTVERHLSHDLLGRFRCLNGLVHILEYTAVSLYIRSDLHLCKNVLYNVLNHLFIYRHSNTSLKTCFP